MTANMTKKESSTVLAIVSIYAIVAMYYLKISRMILGQYFLKIEKSSHNGFSILHFMTQTLKIIYKNERFQLTSPSSDFYNFSNIKRTRHTLVCLPDI